MSTDGVAAVDRALEILAAFAERDDALTLAELSARTGLYKSTILRLIQSLEKYGHLQRTPEASYRIGPKALYLGALYQDHFDPAQHVPPLLRRLAEETHETASFYVREGDTRVCLFRQEAVRAVRASVRQGARLSLDVGAAGHMMLACAGRRGAKYDQIRAAGYAVSVGERDPETAAVACPVAGVRGALAGVLNISVPCFRLEQVALASLVPPLFRYAGELSRLYGGVLRAPEEATASEAKKSERRRA